MKNEIKIICSKIGDIEERIYNEFGDDEIENMDFLEDVDSIKELYKNNDEELYKVLELYLVKLLENINFN
jgi:hypothetical protein